MSPVLEISLQVILLVVAIWMFKQAYSANKKVEPFSSKHLTDTKKALKGFDSMFMAGWFVIGAVLLLALAYKLLTCGPICGTLLP